MYAFGYQAPVTLRQAASLLARNEDGKLLAGGHTLLPTMKQRLANPSILIDLSKVEGLRGIERRGRSLVIGAMTTHAEVAASPVVAEAIPGLAALAALIGDPHVRHRGTLGGSVANNDPAADYPGACVGLDATIVTNRRKLSAAEFFTGLYETALEDGEILTKVSFTIPARAAYTKFRNPASRYALVGSFVAKRGSEVRVAITGAGNAGVFRWAAAEAALTAKFAARSIEGLVPDAADMLGDMHASQDYRAHLVGVMTRRAVTAALGK